MVGGVRIGLVEAETLLGGEEAVAFVAWPFRRSFLGVLYLSQLCRKHLAGTC